MAWKILGKSGHSAEEPLADLQESLEFILQYSFI